MTEQLTGAQLGAQQLTQYSDRMTGSKLKLEAIRQRAQVALRTPIKLDGSDINDTHIKVGFKWYNVSLYLCHSVGSGRRFGHFQI